MLADVQRALGMECLDVPSGILTRTGVLFSRAEADSLTPPVLRSVHAARACRRTYDFDYARASGMVRVMSPAGSARAVQEANVTRRAAFVARLRSLFKREAAGTRRTPFVARLRSLFKREKKAPGIIRHTPETAPSIITGIRIALTLIGIVSAVLSINYLRDFLFRSNTPVVANILSVTMVLAMFCFCELAILFFQRKQLFLAFGFALFWLLPVSFTIAATVDANFYRYMAADAGKGKVEAQHKGEDRSLTLLQEATRQAQAAVTGQEADIAKYKTREDPLLWKIEAMNKALLKLRTDYTAAANAEIQYTVRLGAIAVKKDTPAEIADRPSSFDYIAKLAGIDAKFLQFIMSLIPALFNEFMAPIAIGVAMFLKPKGE